MRTAAPRAVDINGHRQYAGDTFDDRQAQAEAARNPRALIEPVKLDEDVAALGLWNADAGIVNVDAQIRASGAAADQHLAIRRVFDGVGDEVLHQPAQQPAVRSHHQRTRNVFQFDAFGGGERCEFKLDLAHHVIDAE